MSVGKFGSQYKWMPVLHHIGSHSVVGWSDSVKAVRRRKAYNLWSCERGNENDKPLGSHSHGFKRPSFARHQDSSCVLFIALRCLFPPKRGPLMRIQRVHTYLHACSKPSQSINRFMALLLCILPSVFQQTPHKQNQLTGSGTPRSFPWAPHPRPHHTPTRLTSSSPFPTFSLCCGSCTLCPNMFSSPSVIDTSSQFGTAFGCGG